MNDRPTAPDSAADAVSFDAPRMPLLVILAKAAPLIFLTVGGYWFWTKTQLRAFWWRHVIVDGEPLEYVGRPIEMLNGFVKGLAVLVPVGVVSGAAAYILQDAGQWSWTVFTIALAVTLVFLMHAARFQMRRYRMERTAWRGIRFGIDGAALPYAALATAGWLGLILSLGVAYPWVRVALHDFTINRTRFGNQFFAFKPVDGALVGAWLPVVGAGAAVLALFVGVNFGALSAWFDAWQAGATDGPAAGSLTYLPLLGAVVPVVLHARYRVCEFRYFADSTSLSRVSFTSGLRIRQILLLYAVHLLLIVAAVAATILVLLDAALAAAAANGSVSVMLPAMLFFILVGLWWIVRTAWLEYEVARTVCDTLSVAELEIVRMVGMASEAPGDTDAAATAPELAAGGA